ncbi:MAG: HPr kinase/phosphorylase [Spirochaetaceae bacterium]|nr:HPr kinase/phosphorylase [Spirochaetaceae bacterium]
MPHRVDAKKFSVLDLLEIDLSDREPLGLSCISGQAGLSRLITSAEINRPGLAIAGFFDSFSYSRIQLFGLGEHAFLERLTKTKDYSACETFFGYDIPCCVFSSSLLPPDWFVQLSQANGCPILTTSLNSSAFLVKSLRLLSAVFAPKTTIHGVMVEVFGLGILILGDSGVGKSETALELVNNGHRLIADDVVEIYSLSDRALIAQGANSIIAHHMEIRGLGIINVQEIFGIGSILDSKRIDLVAKLEEWDNTKIYDRLGTDELTTTILGVKIPTLEIPIKPGRNIPAILETAAKNERLKATGYFAAREFNNNVLRWIESDSSRAAYYHGDEEY